MIADAGLRILMLAGDAHGGFGGISQYNRDILDAIAGFERVREVVVLPRIVRQSEFIFPQKVHYDLTGVGGAKRFVWRSAAQALAGGRWDLIFCAHIRLLPIAAAIAYLRRVPVVLAIHGVDAWQPRWPSGPKLAKHADLVLSVSKITLDRFRSWSKVDECRTAVVPNTIRLDRYGLGEKDPELVRRLGLSGRKVIMTLGRMSADERYKGFDEIIEVMSHLRELEPRIVYLAAGDGDDRPRLEAKARKLGVDDHVMFTGQLPESRKADYYRLADAYVMPSSGEGFGIVVLEALACGIPVVASAADGTQEAVRNGELGTIVNPKDSSGLKVGIMEAISRPRQISQGLDFFSFENFARRLHMALARVVSI